jgi:serine/threonine-protein kinase
MDFGTAVRAHTRLDYEAGLYGTVAYLAPEQIRGGVTVDGRADLYALGAVLYRMVTGQRPFEGTREDVLEAHLHAPPAPVPRRAKVSEELEAVIRRALSKDPDDRHLTGAELLAELDRVASSAEQLPTGLVDRWRARRRGSARAGGT